MGWLDGASAGEPLATAAELMYCVRGTMPRTDDVPHCGTIFSHAASARDSVAETPTFPEN